MTSFKLPAIALVIALAMFACDEPDTSPPYSGDVTLQVSYELDFMREEFSTPLVTNLGYEVEIDTLVIANYSLELLPCPTTTSIFDLLIPSAHAGHPEEDRPLASPRREYEAWHLPARTTSMGTRELVTSTRTSFCQVHYLIARSDDTFATSRYEPEVDMDRLSLLVEGTWRRGDTPPTPFHVESAINHGKNIPLGAGPLTLDTSEVSLTVTVTRQRDGLFDGVDFAVASEQDIARTMLRHIIDHAEVRATP